MNDYKVWQQKYCVHCRRNEVLTLPSPATPCTSITLADAGIHTPTQLNTWKTRINLHDEAHLRRNEGMLRAAVVVCCVGEKGNTYMFVHGYARDLERQHKLCLHPCMPWC